MRLHAANGLGKRRPGTGLKGPLNPAWKDGTTLRSRKGNYESVEIMGLYWHFVDLVWVFIFALFYLW